MDDKELYRQKAQAQLDQWQAEIERLKAKAAEASADAQLELNGRVTELEAKLQDGKRKLAAAVESSGDLWESAKENAESSWSAFRRDLDECIERFKNA